MIRRTFLQLCAAATAIQKVFALPKSMPEATILEVVKCGGHWALPICIRVKDDWMYLAAYAYGKNGLIVNWGSHTPPCFGKNSDSSKCEFVRGDKVKRIAEITHVVHNGEWRAIHIRICMGKRWESFVLFALVRDNKLLKWTHKRPGWFRIVQVEVGPEYDRNDEEFWDAFWRER